MNFFAVVCCRYCRKLLVAQRRYRVKICGTYGGIQPEYDSDGDADVDFVDFAILSGNFTGTIASPRSFDSQGLSQDALIEYTAFDDAIPVMETVVSILEPAMVSLLILSCLSQMCHRR